MTHSHQGYTQVKSTAKEHVTVDYMGGTVEIPVGFHWLAISTFVFSGITRYMLTAFEQKPTLQGTEYVVAPNTNFAMISEVHPCDVSKTLQQVAGFTPEQKTIEICRNFAISVFDLLNDSSLTSDEEREHALMCGEHGIVKEFFDSLQKNAIEQAGIEDDEDLPEGVRVHPHGLSISGSSGVGQMLKATIGSLLAEQLPPDLPPELRQKIVNMELSPAEMKKAVDDFLKGQQAKNQPLKH